MAATSTSTSRTSARTQHAIAAGAQEQEHRGNLVVLRSPAGLTWCSVAHEGEHTRPQPQPAGQRGAVHIVDQLCIDIPPDRYRDECASWARVTGWQLRQSPGPA